MGNIRPTYIKRVAQELVERYPDQFGPDFERNKIKVAELTDISTPFMLNKVSGYLTKLWKRRHAS